MTEDVLQGGVTFGAAGGIGRVQNIASIWLADGEQSIAPGSADVIAFNYTHYDPGGYVTAGSHTFGGNVVPAGAGFEALRAGLYLPSSTMLFRIIGVTLDTAEFEDTSAVNWELVTKDVIFFGFLELYVNGDLRWGRDFRVTGSPVTDYAFLPVAFTADPLVLEEGDVVYLRCTNDSFYINEGGADLVIQGGTSPNFVASRFMIEYLGPVPEVS